MVGVTVIVVGNELRDYSSNPEGDYLLFISRYNPWECCELYFLIPAICK